MENEETMSPGKKAFAGIGFISLALGLYSLAHYRPYGFAYNQWTVILLPFALACLLGSLVKHGLVAAGIVNVFAGIYVFFHGSDLFGYWSEVGMMEGAVLGVVLSISGFVLIPFGIRSKKAAQ